MPEPSVLTATMLARACEVSVSLLAASYALPAHEPLPLEPPSDPD